MPLTALYILSIAAIHCRESTEGVYKYIRIHYSFTCFEASFVSLTFSASSSFEAARDGEQPDLAA